MQRAAMWVVVVLLLCGALALACDPPGGGINGVDPGGTVSGTVALTFTVTSETEVLGVDLYLDDALVDTVTTSPYTYNLDTKKYKNGGHEMYLKVRAKDRADGVSEKVKFNIQNDDAQGNQ